MELIQLPQQAKVSLSPPGLKKSEKVFTTVTFICCCLGASILSLGKVQSGMGYLMWGIYYFIAICYVNFTFFIIAKACYHGNFNNISDIIKCLYGNVFGVLQDLSVIVCNASALTSYISVAADYIRSGIAYFADIKQLMDGTDSQQIFWRRIFKVIMSYCVLFLLTPIRKIQILNKIASFSILLVIAVIVAVSARFVQYALTDFKILSDGREHPKPQPLVYPQLQFATSIISNFPMFLTYFSMHPNVPIVQKNSSGKPKDRFQSIMFCSVIGSLVALAIYIYMGIIQSMMFDASCTEEQEFAGCIEINSNILLNFNSDVPLSIIKLCYSLVIILSYPCLLFPMRDSIMSWFKFNKDTRKGYLMFILIAFILTTICMIVSIFVPDLNTILSLYANIGGVLMFEITPVLIWYKLPLLEQNSFGEQLSTMIDLYQNRDDEESVSQVVQFISKIEGISHSALRMESGLEPSKEVFEQRHVDDVRPALDFAIEKPKIKKETAEKYVDNYMVKDMSKQKFHSVLWRKFVLWIAVIFFCILNILAIVFTFVDFS